nr:biotin--protein ligase [Quercus suber]
MTYLVFTSSPILLLVITVIQLHVLLCASSTSACGFTVTSLSQYHRTRTSCTEDSLVPVPVATNQHSRHSPQQQTHDTNLPLIRLIVVFGQRLDCLIFCRPRHSCSTIVSKERVNILIYAGAGATVDAVRHVTWSLRRLLGPNYAVLTVTGEQILNEPWMSTCALLVMPGGADLPYCRTLNGNGNRKIRQYVQNGGRYLGLCAGGYYGSTRCEFEVGRKEMEVVGDRELAFYPGVCRGLAFPGFVYHSEAGARAVEIEANQVALKATLKKFRVYYNGGGAFVDADKYKDRGVEVIASFTEKLHVETGAVKAAAVFCQIDQGAAILTGVHPEFAGDNLSTSDPSQPDFARIATAIRADDAQRVAFFKACLLKLGLKISQDIHPVPSLSRLHLSASTPTTIANLMQAWREQDIIIKDGREEYIRGENDTFRLEQAGPWVVPDLAGIVTGAVQRIASSVHESLLTDSGATRDDEAHSRSTFQNSVDSEASPHHQPLSLFPHANKVPESKETPHFSHSAYFANLKAYATFHSLKPSLFGSCLLYGEVVTSTSSLLEKNTKLLSRLPIGFTATATTQTAGRGRGSNVWVSPPGSLLFSTVLRHSLALGNAAPVVFVQYIAALAIVAGIQKYDGGYGKLPVKLKWPNDIYARSPKASTNGNEREDFVKIGGILVNSSYSGGDYTLIVGIGLNVTNAAATTSLSQLATKENLPSFVLEKLLPSILTQFEALYSRFCQTGWDAQFEKLYYGAWLHTDQIVTLDASVSGSVGGERAIVRGITSDWGLLVAEELGWQDQPTGKKWALQSDGNSFDFFRGLVKRKI